MIGMFTDFKLWDIKDRLQTYWVLSKITFATSYSTKTRFVYYPNGSYALMLPPYHNCNDVIQQLFIINI